MNARGEIKLVFPTEEYKEQIQEYLQEHFDNEEYILHGDGKLHKIIDIDEWFKVIRNDLSPETVEEGRVPATIFLGIRNSDNRIVGTIQIRHILNEKLLRRGGHIGDGVRPTERGKGYATEMIRLAIEECKKLNLTKVLMVCYEQNVASRKTILANGGVLENKILAENGKVYERYWIDVI